MEDRKLKPYKNYQWIVADPRLLEGKFAFAALGSRIVHPVVLGEGLSLERIENIYGPGVRAAVLEALRAAAEAIDVPSPL